MAYMSQEMKKSKEPAIKLLLKKYGFVGSLSVHHYSTLVLSIRSGCVDVFADYSGFKDGDRDYIDVNTYWYQSHFTGETLKFLDEAKALMMQGNHNNSDIMTDYFDVGWYIDIRFGKWDKPYQYTEPKSIEKRLEMANARIESQKIEIAKLKLEIANLKSELDSKIDVNYALQVLEDMA